MRIFGLLIGLTAMAALLLPQGGPQPPAEGLPAELRNYFTLTDEQVRHIAGINQNYQSTVGVKEATLQQLRQQIAIELQKPVLEPAAIGTRYVAVEQALREERAAQAAAIAEIGASLTPSQRAKLQTLQDALNLQPLAATALKENFLAPPPVIPEPPAIFFRKLPERLPSGVERRN